MDEFGNMKSAPFKNDAFSMAVASVPMFSDRQAHNSTSHSFQNTHMASPYSFALENTLSHHSGAFEQPLFSLSSSLAKINPKYPEQKTRHVVTSMSKPPLFSYPSSSPVASGNVVTTNGFFNASSHPDVTKHSFGNVMSAQTIFNEDLSNNAHAMLSKTQYHVPQQSVNADTSHFNQRPVSAYCQTIGQFQEQVEYAESENQQKSQKVHEKVTPYNPSHYELNCLPNATSQHSCKTEHNVDNLSKLSSGKTFYKCGFCEVKLSSNEALLGHVNTHTELLLYTCSLCGVSFVEGRQLMKHVQLSHSVKAPYACGICNITFHQNSDLKKHVEAHNTVSLSENSTADLLEEKDIEGASSPNSDAQKEDIEPDSKDIEDDETAKSLDPSECAAVSSSDTILISKTTSFNLRKEPSKIVMNDMDLDSVCTVIVEPSTAGGVRKKHLFKCNYCQKVCKDKGSLVSHVRTHTKGRPYECNVCSAKFKQYAHLSDHIMTKHTKDRPYVCDRCAKAFNRKSHLQDHIRLRHTEDKLYHCTECPLTFQKRSEFSEHKRTHGKPSKYQCNLCPRQFRNVTDYERHIRSHTKEKRFECEICHLTFGLLANAKKHMIKHNEERPFKCDICPKAYHFEHDFKRHKITHLKKKPFPCLDCYKSFKSAALLKKHSKIAHNHLRVEGDSDKLFHCLTCNKHFKLKCDLEKHLKNHTSSQGENKLASADDNGMKSGEDYVSVCNSAMSNQPKRRGRPPKKQLVNSENNT